MNGVPTAAAAGPVSDSATRSTPVVERLIWVAAPAIAVLLPSFVSVTAKPKSTRAPTK